MTETMCRYSGERDQALVAFLYDEIDPSTRASFEAHLATCAQCRGELSALRGLRPTLRRWAPPEPAKPFVYGATGRFPGVGSVWSRLRDIPAWAQVAAAMLFLGVGAGVANLDVRYDPQGLSIRTGWSRPVSPAAAAPPAGSAPWHAELAALEDRLRGELGRSQPSPLLIAAQAQRPAPSLSDIDVLRRVRALIDESERRQQRELALRVADVMRDVDSQRRADLSKIDRNLGAIQNNTGVEVMKQRELLNYLVRASQNK
jgi:putative zinc finger protein